MKRTKKFLALALLLSALITVGCGSGGEQEAAAGTSGTEAGTSEMIGAGTGENTELDVPEAGTGDAESDGKSDGTENTDGERVSSNKDMYIFLTNLELDGSKGTAYLHIVNRTEDSTISVTIDEVRIDGRESEWQSDGITVAGGETGDMAVHFSKPDSGDDLQELSECAYIRFGAAAPGLYGKEDAHVSFYVKGDKEIAEEIDKTMSKTKIEVYVEEQELYNANGIVITIPEQTISPSTYPTFHLECQYDHGLYYSFLDLKVDGELIAKGSHSNADGEIYPAEPSDDPIPVDFLAAVESGRDSGEITFVLDIWDDIMTSIDKPEITISYRIVTE